MAISSRGRRRSQRLEDSRESSLLPELLSPSSMPPPGDEFGNGGWQGGERVLRKGVFIG